MFTTGRIYTKSAAKKFFWENNYFIPDNLQVSGWLAHRPQRHNLYWLMSAHIITISSTMAIFKSKYINKWNEQSLKLKFQ
jgi:hypothetical protein